MTEAERALVEAALSLSRHDMNIREIGRVSALLAARKAVIAERTPPEAADTLRQLWVSAWKAQMAAEEYGRRIDGDEAEAIRMAAYDITHGGEKT